MLLLLLRWYWWCLVGDGDGGMLARVLVPAFWRFVYNVV